MQNYGYRKNGGIFILIEGNEPIFQSESIFMLIDKSTGSMMKHGEKSLVEKRFNAMQDGYRKNGLEDMADDIVMIDVSELPVEEINKALNISSYGKIILEQYEQK